MTEYIILLQALFFFEYFSKLYVLTLAMMSQQSQTTDETEVDLQPNTWDSPGELAGNSIDSLALRITCPPQYNILPPETVVGLLCSGYWGY